MFFFVSNFLLFSRLFFISPEDLLGCLMPFDDNYIFLLSAFSMFLPLVSSQNAATALHAFVFITVLWSCPCFILTKQKKKKKKKRERETEEKVGVGGSRRDDGKASWHADCHVLCSFLLLLCLVGSRFWYLLTRFESPVGWRAG